MGAVIVLMAGVIVTVLMRVSAVVMIIMEIDFVRRNRLLANSQRRMPGIVVHAVRLGVVVFGRGVHGRIIVPPQNSIHPSARPLTPSTMPSAAMVRRFASPSFKACAPSNAANRMDNSRVGAT